ncbi:uncharacterized protein KZ484_024429 [Pholidichthys leucotaenia]
MMESSSTSSPSSTLHMLLNRATMRVPTSASETAENPRRKKAVSLYLDHSPTAGSYKESSKHLSSASNLLSEDQFKCSICLDVFTDPVSTPCGHNFCKNCITQNWDISDSCQCPMCKESFNVRPQLKINTFISEMVSKFRCEVQQKSSSSSSDQQAANSGEVLCDICTGTKLKALKSCLVCLLSYCETHLEPHLTMKGLKRHQLMEPVENLEGRMCTKHDKPLELFCKNDQMCVCALCSVLDHKAHALVPLREEYEGRKAELGKTEAELQQMIQIRRLNIEKIKESVKMSKDAADREKAEGVQVFTALKESVERGLKQLIKEIEDKQKTTEKQAEDFIKDLEQEISELMEKSSELQQILKSEDHLRLLQSVSSMKAAAPTKDWTEVRVHPPSYEGTVVRAVNQLEETIRKQLKKKSETELKKVQQSAVDVTLDPDTAHAKLILSDDGKQVKCGDVKKNLPQNPERFSICTGVLGKQSFSSGKFYFEVQVKGKTDWSLGVARESTNRKGEIKASPQTGFWVLVLRNENRYTAADFPPVRLHLHSAPEKVGVFVDYEGGLVSFYDADAAALIYSYTGCSFSQKLHPFFSPYNNDGGKNSAPLVITTISPTKYFSHSAVMSASRNRPEDQFQCSICRDVFSDPVSTPCGHNFCKNCITQLWNQSTTFKCPNCNENFYTKPHLKINTFIREMVSQFKSSSSSSSSEQQAVKPGEVPCDVCTGIKLKALKSCLVCLMSYCETHLEPHLTMNHLKRHQLMEPVENLEGRMCMKHDKPLELFCKTDQTCVCALCSVLDHKAHECVPLMEEYEGRKVELGKTEVELQQMIQKRRLKIAEIKKSVKMSKDAADIEKADGVQVFTALKESVERGLKQFLKEIKDKQETTEKQAEDFIKDLEQEISELMERSSEVEQLLKSEDHLHLLQSFSSLKDAQPTKNWTEVRVRPPSYVGTVVRAVDQLEKTIRKQMKEKFEAELKKVQQSAVDVTLDPDTASPYLILSDDGKQVKNGHVKKLLPDNPKRFSNDVCILGKQSFSSGKFYFEVQVKGKMDWALGVARESVNRKGTIMYSPLNGFWIFFVQGGKYLACENVSVPVLLHSAPEKVGVFVDYEKGLVSFYDVDAKALIYSFTDCCFNHKLYPLFDPCLNPECKNSVPLIITPISSTE